MNKFGLAETKAPGSEVIYDEGAYNFRSFEEFFSSLKFGFGMKWFKQIARKLTSWGWCAGIVEGKRRGVENSVAVVNLPSGFILADAPIPEVRIFQHGDVEPHIILGDFVRVESGNLVRCTLDDATWFVAGIGDDGSIYTRDIQAPAEA